MVNKKPSTGCATCRSRHIRCDEARPGCQKCAARGLACPGYRDVGGLIFVNSTNRITERHKKRSDAIARRQENSSPSSLSSSESCSRSPSYSPSLKPEEIAIAFFFTEYVNETNKGMITTRSHMNYLIPMYFSAASDSALALATTALALEALNLYDGKDSYRRHHISYEMRACQQLKAAVANPWLSQQDETLMAVMCLDFTEHLSSKKERRQAARAHIDGALALVRHRPEDSFKNDAARALFAATRSNVLLQSLWYGDAHAINAVCAMPKLDIGDVNPPVNLQYTLVRALALEMRLLGRTSAVTAPQEDDEELAISMVSELALWWTKLPQSWLTVCLRPLGKGRRTVEMLQAAYIIGQWHCVKVLVLKLLCATTEDESVRQSIPFEVELTLQRLLLVCEYLNGDSSVVDDSSAIEKIMDRSVSNMVVARRHGANVNTNNAANNQEYLLNVLRWILDELTEVRPAGSEDFAYPSKSQDSLQRQLDALLGTFMAK